MLKPKIKTPWATVRITNEQAIVVYTKLKDKPALLLYDNLDAFRQALADKTISAQKWGISVSDDLCIKKNLDLPAQSLDEAARMLEFELASLVPIPPDEIVYGCTALKQDENVFEICVYILRKQILDQQLEPYRAIGINPEKVITNSIALYSAFLGFDTTTSVFLCPEKNRYHFLTTVNGHLQNYYCLINIDVTKAPEYLTGEIIHREVELKAYSDNISIIIAAQPADLAETVSETLNNKGILSSITVTSLPACLPDNATSSYYDSALAIGTYEAIMGSRYKHLNLLSAKRLNLIKTKEKRKNALFQTGIAVLVLLLFWANFSVWNWRIKRACHKVRGLIAPIENIATEVEQKKLLVRAIQAQISDRHKISKVFNELYKYSPESITISDLRYHQKTGKQYLSLKGQTDSLPKAFDYAEAMKKSSLLNQMQINNVQQIPTPGGSIVEFKAECLLQDK